MCRKQLGTIGKALQTWAQDSQVGQVNAGHNNDGICICSAAQLMIGGLRAHIQIILQRGLQSMLNCHVLICDVLCVKTKVLLIT